MTFSPFPIPNLVDETVDPIIFFELFCLWKSSSAKTNFRHQTWSITFGMRERFGQSIAIKCYISSFVTTLLGDCFSCCYPQVVIRRRPLFYTVNLLLPSIFLMVMDIVGFYLPPDSGERVSFKITLLLGYSVFLIIVSDTLPATAIGTPLIGKWSILFWVKKQGWNAVAVWSRTAEWKMPVISHESCISYEGYRIELQNTLVPKVA